MVRSKSLSSVLVTGFPSLLARRVARRLLEVEDDVRLNLLVESSELPEGRSFLDGLPREKRERVVLMEGCPWAMDLGLSGKDLRHLTRDLSRIYHGACSLDESLSARDAERLNGETAREILEVAGLCSSLRSLVFLSSVRVFGDRTGRLAEAELDVGQSFRSPFEESHARAEKRVRQVWASERRLPVVVARAGLPIGDSRTGEIDQYNEFYRILEFFLASPPDWALPIPDPGVASLPLVPIDYLAHAVHALGRIPQAVGKTVHLVDPAPPPARRVFELLARATNRRLALGPMSVVLANALLGAPFLGSWDPRSRRLLEGLAKPTVYETRTAEDLLSGPGGVECPLFESYVDVLVGYFQKHPKKTRVQEEGPVVASDPLF